MTVYDFPILTTLLSPKSLNIIQSGIETNIKLIDLIYSPNPAVWQKWLVDEEQIQSCINTIHTAVQTTAPFVNTKKYKKAEYDPIKEIAKMVEVFLFNGRTPTETIVLERQFLPVFYTLLIPIIDGMEQLTHQGMVDNSSEICNALSSVIWSTDSYGTYQQALDIQKSVMQTINTHEAAALQLKVSKRKVVKRDPLLELLQLIPMTNVEDLD